MVVEGPGWPILLGRITPSKAIAIDEDNATQNFAIIDARLAMAFGKERLQPRHLRVCQPEKDCSSFSLLVEAQSRCNGKINGS